MPFEVEVEKEPKIKVEVDRDTLKEILKHNPATEAVEACMRGVWAGRWASSVTGITKEEVERVPEMREVYERTKRRLCTKLVAAMYEG